MLSPIFEKKCGVSPAGPSAGGKNRTFFQKSANTRGAFMSASRIVFLEGGPISPCSRCTHKKFIDAHIRRRGDQVYIPRAGVVQIQYVIVMRSDTQNQKYWPAWACDA